MKPSSPPFPILKGRPLLPLAFIAKTLIPTFTGFALQECPLHYGSKNVSIARDFIHLTCAPWPSRSSFLRPVRFATIATSITQDTARWSITAITASRSTVQDSSVRLTHPGSITPLALNSAFPAKSSILELAVSESSAIPSVIATPASSNTNKASALQPALTADTVISDSARFKSLCGLALVASCRTQQTNLAEPILTQGCIATTVIHQRTIHPSIATTSGRSLTISQTGKFEI